MCPGKRLSGKLINISLLIVSCLIALVLAELVFRVMLFNKNNKFKSLKNPGDYADYFNEDNYWKLYYLFDGEYKPPANPHPLFGWIGDFDRNSLMHNQITHLSDKRPVLLYGDSYAQCMPGVKCFQEIFNNDSSFSKNNYLLNYGVGGYGVDQIDLLFKKTVHHFDNPFVIFSLMVSDLDRSILTVRTGQKPYYTIAGDSLQLSGVPLESDPKTFFDKNPPRIKSYLWRKFLYGKMNFMPWKLTSRFRHDKRITDYKIKLNTKILEDVLTELRTSKIDFIFVVFHYIEPGNPEFSVDNDDDWRDNMIRSFLVNHHVPYVWTKDLIRNDDAYKREKKIDRYMIPENGHPTTYFNSLIADAMKRKMEEINSIMNDDSVYYINRIHSDPVWMQSVADKAKDKNKPIDQVTVEDATYVMNEKKKNYQLKNGQGFYVKEISQSPVWMKSVSEKAKSNNTSVEHQILLDAEYMAGLQIKEEREKWSSGYYSVLISNKMSEIKNNPQRMQAVAEKAKQKDITPEEELYTESLDEVRSLKLY